MTGKGREREGGEKMITYTIPTDSKTLSCAYGPVLCHVQFLLVYNSHF